MRSLFIHQLCLEETSPALHTRIIELVEKLEATVDQPEQQIMLLLETGRIHHYYGFVEKAHRNIERASEIAGISYCFSGESLTVIL